MVSSISNTEPISHLCEKAQDGYISHSYALLQLKRTVPREFPGCWCMNVLNAMFHVLWQPIARKKGRKKERRNKRKKRIQSMMEASGNYDL